jgi:hypothetical protein
MEKAKFMLTAIAVFAIVGGALAFKAKRYGNNIFCGGTNTAPCNVAKTDFTITSVGGVTSRCYVLPLSVPCTVTHIIGSD